MINSSFYLVITIFIIIKLITVCKGVKFSKAGRLLFSFNILLQSMSFLEILCVCIQFFFVLSFSAKACFGHWENANDHSAIWNQAPKRNYLPLNKSISGFYEWFIIIKFVFVCLKVLVQFLFLIR